MTTGTVMRARKAAQNMPKDALYDVLRTPVITEKATAATERSEVVFRVSMEATKPQIKAAVEALFGVKVEGVNTLVQKGKAKRFKGRPGRRADVKKAYVKLQEGQSIDFSSKLA